MNSHCCCLTTRATLAFQAKMPRMPMIAATPLLLLLLSCCSPAWAKPTVRPIPTNEPFPIQEESTASFADVDGYTMTVEVDPDIVLTTEDSVQLFTHLADHSGTTTEEPLPESVLLQLEQERDERDRKLREEIAAITTEEPTKEQNKYNATKKATPSKTRPDGNATTKATPAKTTMSWMTTPPTSMEAGFVKSVASLNEEPMEPIDEQAEKENSDNNFKPINNNFNSINSEKDMERGDSKIHSVVETTTYLPQGDEFTTVNNNREELASTEFPEPQREVPSTLAPVKESFQFTSRPFMSDLSEFGTESMLMEQTTWLPDLALLVESTIQPELIVHTIEPGDKVLPAIDPLASTTTEVPGDITTTNEFAEFAETTTGLPKPIKMMAKITTSTTEQPTTDQPTTVLPTTEQSTTEQSTTEQTTTSEATTLPVTTTESPKFQQMVDTTTTTSTTSSTATSTTSTTTEATTVAAPAQQETTIAAPKQQPLLEAIETTARPVETTTAEAPLPTTQQARVPSTRAPRVERIFNTDGVEILYGYSSVVRTNRA